MNHEKTINRIQELTDGMALEEGCEVICVSESLKEQYKLNGKGVVVSNTQVLFTNGEGRTVDIGFVFHHSSFFEILGKPITIAIVMLAILKHEGLPITYSEAESGDVGNDWSNLMFHFRDMNWNLSKDNFNDQSEETKTFIGGLLN